MYNVKISVYGKENINGNDILTANPEELMWSVAKMDISRVNVVKEATFLKEMSSGKLCLTKPGRRSMGSLKRRMIALSENVWKNFVIEKGQFDHLRPERWVLGEVGSSGSANLECSTAAALAAAQERKVPQERQV